LALIDENTCNHIHLAKANDLFEVKADTELQFTVNNIPMSYTIYELEEALLHGPNGKSPGVQALLRIFGQPKDEDAENDDPLAVPRKKPRRVSNPKGGRPPVLDDGRVTSALVRPSAMSGGMVV
jgi:hypothetical protein